MISSRRCAREGATPCMCGRVGDVHGLVSKWAMGQTGFLRTRADECWLGDAEAKLSPVRPLAQVSVRPPVRAEGAPAAPRQTTLDAPSAYRPRARPRTGRHFRQDDARDVLCAGRASRARRRGRARFFDVDACTVATDVEVMRSASPVGSSPAGGLTDRCRRSRAFSSSMRWVVRSVNAPALDGRVTGASIASAATAHLVPRA